MNLAAKIATAVSVVVVAGMIALAAPPIVEAVSWASERVATTTASQADAASTSDEASVDDDSLEPDDAAAADAAIANGASDVFRVTDPAAPLLQTVDGMTFSAEGPGDCLTNAAIHPYGAHDPGATLRGELVDMGASAFAAGEVGYNAEGLIESYIVLPGDSLIAIGERFCVDFVTVGAYNDRFASNKIQPGDVLILRP
jgi:hypothetical protein